MTTGLAKGKGPTPWVQPLIVLKTGSHEETVRLGASASVAVAERPNLRPQDKEAFAEWLSGPFTKTVRRAALKEFLKAQAWAEESGTPWEVCEHENSSVLALPPMRYDELPREIARLQVSGTDLRRFGPAEFLQPASICSCATAVELSVLDRLTTGKATAQAAHALWAWRLQAPAEHVTAWAEEGFPALVHFLDGQELSWKAAKGGLLSIYDNGLTEVAPKTLTALARK